MAEASGVVPDPSGTDEPRATRPASADIAEPKPTVGSCPISVQGGAFPSDDAATQFAMGLGSIVVEISRDIDLRNLDGITLAIDYQKALAELDRGRTDLQPLSSSTFDKDGAIGAAMAPSVWRDGEVKTHLVFNLSVVAGLALEDTQSEDWQLSLHTLAHECAHVEVTAAMDAAFPGKILQEKITDHLKGRRWEVISATWDEYGATRISATYGADPTGGYLEIFLGSLSTARDAAHDAITAYRTHGDIDLVMTEVVTAYGNLIKYSGYLLGTLDGCGVAVKDVPTLAAALNSHWYAGPFERLHRTFNELWDSWGRWGSREEFEPIADAFIAIMDDGGFHMTDNGDGTMAISIPPRPENTPYHPIWAPQGLR